MECRETEWLIDAYLDRTLSGRVAQEVESHLAKCAVCRGRFGPMMELLSSPEPIAVPDGLPARIVAAVQEVAAERASGRRVPRSVGRTDRGRRGDSRFRWLTWSGAVAASVAFIAAGWMASTWFARPRRPNPIPPEPVAHQTPVVLSPWMLNSLAQAMSIQTPVNPAAVAAQATVTELFATVSFDDVSAISVQRRSATRPAAPPDEAPPSPEIPVLPPILRL